MEATAPITTPNQPRCTLSFRLPDETNKLLGVLDIFSSFDISLSGIRSRPYASTPPTHEFFVDFPDPGDPKNVAALIEKLGPVVYELRTGSSGKGFSASEATTPWFPRRKKDLDTFADKVLEYGAELDADHPGFKDQEYRARREEITAIARTYKHGQPLPRVKYNQKEIETWSTVFTKLCELYPKYACKEHQYALPLLMQNCGYSATNVPQLEDVSAFLKECTGFELRPVMGLLTSRDFLNGLALRVFHSTQYIRHHSKPLYTPEPDLCHELLGHVPLFCDKAFAQFSQQIGMASLGASDEEIEQLSTIYWFTVEFGLCKQDGQVKAYGAGLLSSFGELEHCLSDKPKRIPFDPAVCATTKYIVTEYQQLYFVAESFTQACEKVRAFAQSLSRPFAVEYDPYTDRVYILDSKEEIVQHLEHLKGQISNCISALKTLEIKS